MVIANALPFSLVESAYFVVMVQSLNKVYITHLPLRKTLVQITWNKSTNQHIIM